MKRLRFSLLIAIIFSLTLSTFQVQKVNADDNSSANSTSPPPNIVGTSGITVDIKTGEIIYESKIDDKAYPASTTKLLTSILFAENKKKTDLIPYNDDARKQPEYSLGVNFFKNIQNTDTMSADDVMKALLIFSANDSAYMIADAVAGTPDNFIKMMNDKAKSYGLKNTNFVTANGLHDDNHYTTPYDLSVIARHAISNDWIKSVLGTQNATIKLSNGLNAKINTANKLLGQNGNIGGKTGYTANSGRCLVAFYERNGRSMLGVVMNSAYNSTDTQVFDDMSKIIDWSYSAKKVVKTPANSTVKTIDLQYKPLKFFGPIKTIKAPLIIKENIEYYNNDINKKETALNIKTDTIDPWKLTSNTKVGTLEVKEREYSKTYSLYTNINKNTLMAESKGLFIMIGIAIVAIFILILSLIIIIAKARRRRSRKRTRYYY